MFTAFSRSSSRSGYRAGIVAGLMGVMVLAAARAPAAMPGDVAVNYADLDGNLLISNDPFHGVRVEKGKLVLPGKPGLGLTRVCLLYTSPSPRDGLLSRMPSSA